MPGAAMDRGTFAALAWGSLNKHRSQDVEPPPQRRSWRQIPKCCFVHFFNDRSWQSSGERAITKRCLPSFVIAHSSACTISSRRTARAYRASSVGTSSRQASSTKRIRHKASQIRRPLRATRRSTAASDNFGRQLREASSGMQLPLEARLL